MPTFAFQTVNLGLGVNSNAHRKSVRMTFYHYKLDDSGVILCLDHDISKAFDKANRFDICNKI